MSELTKEHIDQFKQYFLSTEESVKAKLFTALSSADKERLSIVENGFNNSISAIQIALELNAPQFENEIKEIQTEHNSLLQEFEQDLAIAITQTEREALKKKLKAVDANEEAVFNNEIKIAITQVEREALKSQLSNVEVPTKVISFNFNKFAKYAAAAIFIGVVSTIGIWLITRNDNQFDNLGVNTKHNISNAIAKRIITINKNSTDSIYIIVNQIDITKQLNELEQILKEETKGVNLSGSGVSGVGPRFKALFLEYENLKTKYDSLFQIGCTYSFDVNLKLLKLDIYDSTFNEKNLKFIKLKDEYYINRLGTYFRIINSEKIIPIELVKSLTYILELGKISNSN